MKIQLAAVLLTVLVTQGSSLKCHSCNSLTGNCALNTTIECNRTIHTFCRSISISQVIGIRHSNYLLSGCGSCFGLISFNSGFFSSYLHTSCCSSSLCNDAVEPDIENSTLNGLECHACFALSSECGNLTTPVKCRGEQDHCLHTSGFLAGSNSTSFVMKGCASDFLCRSPGDLRVVGLDPTFGFYCCKGALCNRESRNFTLSTTPSTTSIQVNTFTPLATSTMNMTSAQHKDSSTVPNAAPTLLNVSTTGPSTTSTASPTQLSSPLIMAVLLAFLRLVL
ncbi:urokinase plasminogen activator surface receptor-like [Hemiscyllium ocellatum]|uniref:urokinase plasminogen activator surface receptor-like n=1 Tax=Hemiscyllium ocellatum TaxID=170820 RepID=UPI0029667DCA|nr:urokinase plasminogen activator surface receptor-like [Hemiscyllium ocellatum]